jgi:hypothetical protein
LQFQQTCPSMLGVIEGAGNAAPPPPLKSLCLSLSETGFRCHLNYMSWLTLTVQRDNSYIISKMVSPQACFKMSSVELQLSLPRNFSTPTISYYKLIIIVYSVNISKLRGFQLSMYSVHCTGCVSQQT